MIRALYTAASGMMVESQRMDAMTNNLANVQTAGYRALEVVRGGQAPTRGALPSDVQTSLADQYRDLQPGELRTTGLPFDFALEGDGFFTVQGKGGTAYTRNGHFQRHADGRVTDATGNPVLGEKGPLQVSPLAAVTTAEDGTIYADGVAVDRLQVMDFSDRRALRPAGTSLFYAAGDSAPKPGAARVVSATLEDSNVTAMSEMARMIETVRAFESYQKVIQTVMDEVTGEAVQRLGRLA